MLHCTALHCTAPLYYAIYCTVLCYTVLYYSTSLYCTILHYSILCYAIPNFTLLYCSTLHNTVLFCTTPLCRVGRKCRVKVDENFCVWSTDTPLSTSSTISEWGGGRELYTGGNINIASCSESTIMAGKSFTERNNITNIQ